MKILPNTNLWCLAIAAVVCYFIGCFNFAVVISHIKKKDIRSEGSGNPGTMNMTRTFGLKIGAINFFCDVAKGGLPAVIAWIIFKDYVFEGTTVVVSDFMRYFCGLFVIIGHIFPVTMKFKGGKGIASTMGLFVFAIPCEPNGWWYVFIAIAILVGVLLYITFTEWGSMGSLIGVSGLTIFQMVLFILRYADNLSNVWTISIFMILLLINFLTWFAHRINIYKLVAGEEHHTAVRKHKKKA